MRQIGGRRYPIFNPEGEDYDEEIGAQLAQLYPLTVPKPDKYGCRTIWKSQFIG